MFCWIRFVSAAVLGSTWSSAAWAHGALHERIAELKTQLATEPENALLGFQLSQAYCQHGDWEKTLDAVARVEQLASQQFPTEGLVGEAYFGQRKFVEAKTVLDRFLAVHPENASALLTRARVHRALGNEKVSLDDYRAAYGLTTTPERALPLEFADALSSAGQRDEARRVLDDAIKKLGPVPALLTRALELDTALGRYDSALERVLLLQEQSPRPEHWMLRRVRLLLEAGRIGEARASAEVLQRALEALPNLDRGLPELRQVSDQLRQLLPVLEESAENISSLLRPCSLP